MAWGKKGSSRFVNPMGMGIWGMGAERVDGMKARRVRMKAVVILLLGVTEVCLFMCQVLDVLNCRKK